MPGICNYPGCRYSHKNCLKFNLEKQSVFQVPSDQRDLVCKLLKINTADTLASISFCSAHFREDAAVMGRNKKPAIRKDVPFLEMLKLPDGSQLCKPLSQASRPAKHKHKRSLQIRKAKYIPQRLLNRTWAGRKLSSSIQKEEAFEEEAKSWDERFEQSNDDTMNFKRRNAREEMPAADEHASANQQKHRFSIRVLPNSMAKPNECQGQSSSSFIGLSSQTREIESLKSLVTQLETKLSESERRQRHAKENFDKRVSIFRAELEAKDLEILNLKNLVSQISAENKTIIEASLALKQDLGVYRKIVKIQTEKLIQSKHDSPTKASSNQLQQRRDSESIEILEIEVNESKPDESLPIEQPSPSPGKLGELKKWLNNSNNST